MARYKQTVTRFQSLSLRNKAVLTLGRTASFLHWDSPKCQYSIVLSFPFIAVTVLFNNNNNNKNHRAVELVREIGRRVTLITGEPRESTFPFQQLSVALQTGNAVAFLNT